jgi:flagellar basal body P-ring protein FlgI
MSPVTVSSILESRSLDGGDASRYEKTDNGLYIISQTGIKR